MKKLIICLLLVLSLTFAACESRPKYNNIYSGATGGYKTISKNTDGVQSIVLFPDGYCCIEWQEIEHSMGFQRRSGNYNCTYSYEPSSGFVIIHGSDTVLGYGFIKSGEMTITYGERDYTLRKD